MKRSRYKEEQIIAALRRHEAGMAMLDICRELGIVQQTFYRWKSKYGGMDVSEARRLRTLEEENTRLKRIVANQTLEIDAMRAVLSKKW